MNTLVDLRDCRIAIVGLGLMGGSLAGGLRRRCREVIGIARRAETIDLALRYGLIDRGSTHLADGLDQANVVVLATPVRSILEQLATIGPFLSEGCLLMDLGSCKEQIIAAMAQLPEHVQPLGGHPMCGKEVSGIETAEPTLYQDRTFILIPLPRTSDGALGLGRQLVEAVGARPLILQPRQHDRLVARFSHLPYLLACALVNMAATTSLTDPAGPQVAASGFHSVARLAGSDVTMMLDILLTNRDEVLKAAYDFQTQLNELIHLVELDDDEGLRTRLNSVRGAYSEMER